MSENMKTYLPKIEQDKMNTLLGIEDKYESGELTLEAARALLAEKVGSVRPYHLAYLEQNVVEASDDPNECIRVDMTKTLRLLEGFMDTSRPDLPIDHPIERYYRENDEVRRVLTAIEDLVQYPVIRNQWAEIYDKLRSYTVHYSRKQNQLYPVLEQKGFDHPTKFMWTFDDTIKDEIREARALLDAGKDDEFISKQAVLVSHLRNLMEKEETILYQTSLALITDEEFEHMKSGDREIGFAFDMVENAPQKEAPQPAVAPNEFAGELQSLLSKYGYSTGASDKLDVATGKLTLEQINLVYRHLPVDISYVDENEIVAFYSDTEHRVFPRSKNVIGRKVENCHPQKSLYKVREIIDKFRSGEQSEAEFWINKPEVFIYILYVAVRDEAGNFRGVLEMMQDCTHIRSLKDSQTLLSWDTKPGQKPTEMVEEEDDNESNDTVSVTDITPDTRLKDLLSQYKGLRKRMQEINPMFKMLSTPMGRIHAGKVSLREISERSGTPIDELISGINRIISEL